MNERDRTRAKIIGVLIRDARLHAGRSLDECALALGVDPALIEAFETGAAVPALPQIESLAIFLHVPLNHFWGNQTLGNYPETRFEKFLADRQRAIGQAIKENREEAGRSLEDVAHACGFEPEQLETVESGLAHISLFELEQIAAALGRSLNAFSAENDHLLTRHEAEQKQRRRFDDLPPETRSFVTEPINQSYLEIAMRLSRMDVNELRSVAENILNITF